MKISYHARTTRKASYETIKKEINGGIAIDPTLAKTILERTDNKNSKASIDWFFLRKDLLGLYILNKDKNNNWNVITYIDTSDFNKQNLLKNLFVEQKNIIINDDLNFNLSLSKAIISRYSTEIINLIKEKILVESTKFKYVESFPCSFSIEIDIGEEQSIFRISKESKYES